MPVALDIESCPVRGRFSSIPTNLILRRSMGAKHPDCVLTGAPAAAREAPLTLKTQFEKEQT